MIFVYGLSYSSNCNYLECARRSFPYGKPFQVWYFVFVARHAVPLRLYCFLFYGYRVGQQVFKPAPFPLRTGWFAGAQFYRMASCPFRLGQRLYSSRQGCYLYRLLTVCNSKYNVDERSHRRGGFFIGENYIWHPIASAAGELVRCLNAYGEIPTSSPQKCLSTWEIWTLIF